MNSAVLRKDDLTLIPNVECAEFFWERMRGLLGRSSLGEGRAMYLAPCGSIHTFFMRFSIDLVFLSKQMTVKRIVRGVRPNRIVSGGCKAWSVLEMESGWFPSDALHEGDEVSVD